MTVSSLIVPTRLTVEFVSKTEYRTVEGERLARCSQKC